MPGSWRAWIATFTLCAFASVTLQAPATWAQEPDPELMARARGHYEAGQAAYAARDYAGAIRELQAAQSILPSPTLDYQLGLAFEGSGDGRMAAYHYRRYLAAQPEAPERADVEARIVALERATNVPPPPPGVAPAAPPNQGYYVQPQYPVQPQYQVQPQYPYSPPVLVPRRKVRWWLVFPILGAALGVALLGVLIWAVADGKSGSSSHDWDLTVVPPPQAGDRTGAIFRF